MSRAKKVEPQNQNLRAPRTPHIRHIKPEFFTSEKVNDLSPLAALAWIGLWCHSDKNGRFEWKPRVLRVLIFPYRDGVNFEELLHELARARCVQEYVVDGQHYGQIVNWTRHQYISRREADSKFEYPAPPIEKASTCDSPTASKSPHVQERAGTCVNGAVHKGECVSEGKGKGDGQGDGSRTPRATFFSDTDREHVWNELSVLSEDLLVAKRYKGQRSIVEQAAETFGIEFVLDNARQFLPGVVTERDRAFAAKQFTDYLDKRASCAQKAAEETLKPRRVT